MKHETFQLSGWTLKPHWEWVGWMKAWEKNGLLRSQSTYALREKFWKSMPRIEKVFLYLSVYEGFCLWHLWCVQQSWHVTHRHLTFSSRGVTAQIHSSTKTYPTNLKIWGCASNHMLSLMVSKKWHFREWWPAFKAQNTIGTRATSLQLCWMELKFLSEVAMTLAQMSFSPFSVLTSPPKVRGSFVIENEVSSKLCRIVAMKVEGEKISKKPGHLGIDQGYPWSKVQLNQTSCCQALEKPKKRGRYP